MLEKLVNALKSGDEQLGGAAGFLRPFDVDRIARTLDLTNAAAENGRRNIPKSDSAVFDSVEQKVVQEIAAEWSWHGGALVNYLRAYADRLIGYSVNSEFQRLQLKANNTLARLRAEDHRAEGDLGPLRNIYIATRKEIDDFRLANGIKRPARNPSGRWTTFGLLFVLIALESVLNGFFFAKGAEFGILGGVGTAVGISIVNVAFAFLLGLAPARWMRHRRYLTKSAGFLGLLAGVLALFGLHLFATHLRDATASVGEEFAMATALESIRRSPFSFSDLSSLYLFALGILFALSALWKGYSFDDPYPGYGAQWRRYQKALDDYRDVHADLFDELEAIKEDTIKDLDTGIAQIPKYPQEAASIRAQRSAMLQTFQNYEDAAEAAANRLLADYRNLNRQHRTEAPPAHFDRMWKLPQSMLQAIEVQKLIAEPASAVIDIPQALNELRKLSKDVLAEYEKLLVTYPHTTQIK